MQAQIYDWLANGIIEKVEQLSDGDWVSAKEPVLKPRDSQAPVICCCLDFQMFHEETKELQVTLPTIEDNLDALDSAKIFSSLESAHAYFSITAQDSSLRYLNFLANGKIYVYTHLPFGLKNLAA